MINSIIYTILFILPLIFFTDLTRNPYYFQIAWFYVLVCFTWILIFIKWIKDKKIYFRFGVFDLQLLSFVCIAFLSILISYFSDHNYLIPELIEEGKKVIRIDYLKSSIHSESLKKILFTIVNVLLSYYLALNLTSQEAVHKTFHIIFIVGLISSVYGIMQYFGYEIIWPKVLNPFGNRCVSTFGNPNFLSSYIMMTFIVMFAYMLVETKNRWKSIIYQVLFLSIIMVILMYTIKEKNPNLFWFLFLFIIFLFLLNYIANYKVKTVYVGFIFVYYLCLLCTLTRSSWIGLLIGMLVFMILLHRHVREVFEKNKMKFAFMTLLAAFMFLFFPKNLKETNVKAALQRFTEVQEYRNKPYPPLHQRFLIWLCAWDMVKERPILGKGWGCFELFYPQYQGKYLFNEWLSFRTHANDCHNEILQIWSQTGTIGFGIYIWFFVCLLFFCSKYIKTKPVYERVIYIGVFSALPAMLVDNIVNVSLHFCIPAFLFWWIMGILMNMTSSKKIELNINIKYLFALMVLAILLSLISVNYIYRLFGEINYFEGFKYSKRDLLDKAISPLERAEKLHLEVNNNYELGNVYARENRIDDAIYAYYKALAANCGYDEIHFNLATVYLRKGDIKNAYAHYTMALHINPTSRDAYTALGGLFLSHLRGNEAKAIKLFEQAIKFFPNDKDLWNNLGYLYTITKNYEKAINAYENSLRIDPQFAYAQRNLASLYNQLENKKTKLQQKKELLNEKIKLRDWGNVISLSKEILNENPYDSTTLFYMANAYALLGKIDEAIQYYKRAEKITPNNISLLSNLASMYIQKKDYKEAKAVIERILQIDPNDVTAKENLKKIMESKGGIN